MFLLAGIFSMMEILRIAWLNYQVKKRLFFEGKKKLFVLIFLKVEKVIYFLCNWKKRTDKFNF
jgi:hypothetical protein